MMRPHVLISAADLSAWIAKAKPGEVIEYHLGWLAADTDKATPQMSDEEKKQLAKLRNLAFSMSEAELVHLLQRRVGFCVWSYLAVARPKVAAVRREAA